MSTFKSLRKSLLALTLGLGLAASAQAAPVFVYQSYNLNQNQTFDISTGPGLVAETGRWFEFVMGAYDKLVTFSLKSTNPAQQTANYSLYEDTRTNRTGADNALEVLTQNTWSGNTGAQIGSTVTLKDVLSGTDPSVSFTLLANKQYLLFVNPEDDNRLFGDGAAPVVTQVSAVPLPAAFWMFGSAILGFFGFANRRKV